MIILNGIDMIILMIIPMNINGKPGSLDQVWTFCSQRLPAFDLTRSSHCHICLSDSLGKKRAGLMGVEWNLLASI
jgi:hypothetical protein